MKRDEDRWGEDVKPRSGHTGRLGIDKILKAARRGDATAVNEHPARLASGQEPKAT